MKNVTKTINKDNRGSRNVWVEFFRLISIILIMSTHFVGNNAHVHDKWPDLSCGVCAFILISGFFGVWFTEWRTKKIFVLTCVWTFWGFIIFTILAVTTKQGGTPWELIFGRFLGGKYSSWWFLYVYLAFSLIQPFVNRYIQKFNKWITFGTILVLFSCVTILNSSIPKEPSLSWYYLTFNKMFFFLWVYSLGAWVGFHYSQFIREHRKLNIIIWAILFVSLMTVLWYRSTIINFLGKNHIGTYLIFDGLNATCGLSGLIFFYSLPTPKYKTLQKTLLFSGKITLSLYLTHPMTWIITDLWYSNVAEYSLKFYSIKLLIYCLLAIVISIIAYYFINFQEKFIWKLINKKKQQKLMKKRKIS